MVKSRKQGNQKKKVGSKPRRVPKSMGASYVERYLSLLHDPCGGELISPPYAGTDAGYLIRTTDSFVPSINGTGMTIGPVVGSALIDYTPSNYGYNGTQNSAWLGAGYGPGGADPLTTVYAQTAGGGFTSGNAMNNFISAGAVARFRPVAACLKWIPTGAYTSRSGLVASTYYPAAGSLGATALYSAEQNSAQHHAPNGSELHEVRWLPTAADETWSNPGTVATTPGCGTMRIVLRSVDGVATSALIGTLNGYIEATTVWEWIPTATNSVTLNPRVPVPYTTQQVLASIGDRLSEFLYGPPQSHAYASAYRSVRGAIQTGYRVLTAGMSRIQTQAPSLLLSM